MITAAVPPICLTRLLILFKEALMATKIAFTGHRHLTMAEIFPGLDILLKEHGDGQIWITGGAISRSQVHEESIF